MNLLSKLKSRVSNLVSSVRASMSTRKNSFDSMMMNVSKGQSSVSGIIGSIITIVVGVYLFPVVDEAVANANATGIHEQLMGIIPTLYLIGIIVGSVAWFGLAQVGTR